MVWKKPIVSGGENQTTDPILALILRTGCRTMRGLDVALNYKYVGHMVGKLTMTGRTSGSR